VTPFTDFLPDCPFRPVDWRSQLAHRLVGHPTRARPARGDAWLRRAVRFVRAAERRGDPAHPALAGLDPAVAAAGRLRAGDPRLRLEVEARVLAGEDYAAVAARCGLDPAAVEAYVRLHFDLVDRLAARDYVVFAALPDLHTDPRGPSLETVVKALAFHGGPLVLDAALHVFGVRRAPPGSEPAPELAHSLLLAALALGPAAERSAALGLLRLDGLRREIERRTAAGDHAAACPPLDWLPDRAAREAAPRGTRPYCPQAGHAVADRRPVAAAVAPPARPRARAALRA
jgi:hypothetical protein